MKRYTRNETSGGTFDRREYNKIDLDGTSEFCHRKLLTEIAMDLAKKGMNSEAGYHRAMAGMRALAGKVDVLNKEEAMNRKDPILGEIVADKTDGQADIADSGAAGRNKGSKIIHPPPVSNTKERKKGILQLQINQ